MNNCKLRRIVSGFLAIVMVLSVCLVAPLHADAAIAGDDGSVVMNEAYENNESLVPLGPSFDIDALLKWTPELDPDARYSRASIPLKDRVGGFVVNPLANPEAKLQLCAHNDNPSAQSSENFFSYAFNYWQYTDSFIYWGGTGEGFIQGPTGELIDAAHTNGVPIVGTLGFPWGYGTGYVEQVSAFCQKAEDGSFPVADKLIEVMDYYGFDGWFFNQESYGCNTEIANRLNEMMRYMHVKRPDIIISWYDSMINTGSVSYQDAVNSSNKLWMEPDENGVWGVDEFFMNYNWTNSKINTTISTMNSIGRSQFDAFAGFNVQSNVYGDRLQDHLLVDEDGLARISLSLYYSGQTVTLAKDGEEFHKTEQAYYVNAAGDPRVNNVDVSNASVSEWAGMSRFFADKTPVTGTPFVTDFNTGHGKLYFVNGEVYRDSAWSYQSNQDVLPTWTWIIDSEGAKLEGGYDFTDAYNGGSSVKFSGSLDAGKANDIMLYSTKVAIENGMTMGLTYKGDQGVAKLVAYVGDASTTGYEDCQQVVIALDESNGAWTTTTADLSAHAGKTLYAIGLKIESAEAIADYQLNLGRLTLIDKNRSALSGPSSVTLERILYTDAYEAEARVYWDSVTGASSYEVYKVNADGSKALIMETPNTALHIPTLIRDASEEDVTLEVVAVNRNGVRGNGTQLTIDWAYGNEDSERVETGDSVNVALGATVTAYSEQGDGAECDKALDGISGNASKWWASGAGDWMAIDLGQEYTITRWRVLHAEAGGEGKDLNTDTFSLAYKDAGGNWVEVKRISGNTDAITDVLLDQPITAREWRLYIHRCGPSPWTAVNIYEWEMYETGFPATEPVPMQFATAMNNTGAADTFTLTHVPAGATVKVYTKSVDEYTLIGETVASSDEVVLEDLDFGTSDAGRVYYSITASGYTESAKLSAAFDAEAAEKSAPATNVEFVEYSQPGSVSSSNGDDIFTSLTVKDLAEGDVVYVYENGADTATKTSLPVAEGETSVTIDAVRVIRTGGSLTLQVKRAGMLVSDKYSVETPAFADPIATLQVFAKTDNGDALTGVCFSVVDESGEEVAQMSTTSDSGARAEVPLGTYTIKCIEVPEGFELAADVTKLVTIEGWTYEITVVLTAGDSGETEPTDPVAPEPTDPAEPEETENVALNADIIAYNGTKLNDAASGPEKLFDGNKTDADNGKWCEDGNNLWVAFDIGEERSILEATMFHAGSNNEWSPSPGAINTANYELYVLNTDAISVEELLAMSFEERTALLEDNSYWTVVGRKTDNLDDITTNDLEGVTARIFKVNISRTDTTGWGPCVRIYELELTAVKEPELLSRDSDIVAYNGTKLNDTSAGPEKLFDGAWANQDTDKWCEDGKNLWVAFDIGNEATVTNVKVYHAGAANEWSPSPGAINTAAYELYVLNTDKISVSELLAKTFDERTELLADNSYWTQIAAVTDNLENITSHDLDLDNARIFKINISDTDSTNWGDCIRLYEVEVTGITTGATVDPEPNPDPADKAALNALIEFVETLDGSGYTNDSWAAFQEVLDEAKAVSADDWATQEEVDAIREALMLAFGALEEKVEEPVEFDKILHLDNGRKLYSKDWIIALLNEMSAAGYTQLQLAFGNDGLRFLLDDMSVTVGGTTYSSEDVTAGIEEGNKAYHDEGTKNALTEAEMDEIIAHAQSVGIEIVPHMNVAGHMNAILDAIEYVGIEDAHYMGWVESVSSMNLENEEALAFTLALLEKYVNYFAGKGCGYFHIGADEYANDAFNGNMGFPTMGSALYTRYANFVNDAAEIVKDAGLTPRAWNDGISYTSYSDYFDTDIQITYWSSGWWGYNVASASSLHADGHGMINTHGDYYYILGKDDKFTSGNTTNHDPSLYTECAGYSINNFMGGSYIEDPVGGMFCIWSDFPGAETETEVAENIRLILRAMAKRMDGESLEGLDESVVAGGFNEDGTINGAEVHEHSFGEWVVTTEPTCTETGIETRTCECGETETREIDMIDHSFGEWIMTFEPTCTDQGIEFRECEVCGQTEGRYVDALGHDYEAVVTEPTCTEGGYTTYTCSRCGDAYVTDETDALGHDYEAVVTEPTCTEGGYTTYTCSRCGDSYVDDETDALGHDYEAVVTEPTCTEGGYTTYTCAVCGDSYVDNETAALGHDYESVVVEPTETEQGYTEHTCKVCGDVYRDNYTEPTGPEVTEPEVTEPEVTEPETTEPEVPATSKPAGEDDSADTSDAVPMLLMTALLLVSAAAMVVLVPKLRRED